MRRIDHPSIRIPDNLAGEGFPSVGITDGYRQGLTHLNRGPERCKMLAIGDIVFELDVLSPVRQSSLVEIGRREREPGIEDPL